MATTPSPGTGEVRTAAARPPRAPARKIEWDDSIEDLYDSWYRRVAAAEHGHRVMADRMRRRHLLVGGGDEPIDVSEPEPAVEV